MKSKGLPFVSIGIAAYNEEKRIAKCLDSILRTNYPKNKYEIIVVDDGSTDNTAKIVEKYAGKYPVRLVRKKNGGVGSARNAVIKNARGDVIAFSESDIVVTPNWLIELVKHLNDLPKVMAVGGQNILPPDIDWFGRLVGKVYSSILGGGIGTRYGMVGGKFGETYHNPGCNVAFKRTVYELVGTYNEKIRYPGDDIEFDARVREHGYMLLYNPKSIVYHYRKSTLRQFLKQSFAYGSDNSIISRMHSNVFNPSLALPSVFIVYLLIGAIISYQYTSFRELFLFSLAVYVSICFLSSVKQTRNPKEIATIFFLYILHHLHFGAGYLKGLFFDLLKYKWP